MGLKTVERIGPLLDLFTTDRPVWELGDVAVALNAPRSTVHGLLTSLVSTGLLASPSRGLYELGDRVVAMSNVVSHRVDLRAEASYVLHGLADQFGETVNLGILRGGRVTYLDKIPGRQLVTVVGAPIGSNVEANRSAMGKVMLALGQSDSGTPESHPGLAMVRKQGFATDMGDVSPEVRCLSAAVKGPRGNAIAAISISTTPVRFERSKSKLVEAIVLAANAIESRLAV